MCILAQILGTTLDQKCNCGPNPTPDIELLQTLFWTQNWTPTHLEHNAENVTSSKQLWSRRIPLYLSSRSNVTNVYFRKINLQQRKLNYWQIASKPKKMQKRSDLLESFLDKNTMCHSCDIFNIMWHSCQLWQICDKGVTPYLTELFETYYMCDYTV